MGYSQSQSRRLDATFAALADPTRRAILLRLARGEVTVMALARPFAMSQPAISKHLKVLEQAGLISRIQDAQRRPRRIEAAALAEANGWMESFRALWEFRYDKLDDLLEEMKTLQGDKKGGKHAARNSTENPGKGRKRNRLDKGL